MDWQQHFQSSSFEGDSDVTLQADNIAAINRYMVETPANNPKVIKLRDEWIRWHDGLTWWEKNIETATYDRARNLRNEFNLLNATTPAEKEAVKNVQTTGLTSEELEGGVRRVLSSGNYSEASGGLLPPGFALGIGATLAVLVGGYTALKLSPAGWLLKKG